MYEVLRTWYRCVCASSHLLWVPVYTCRCEAGAPAVWVCIQQHVSCTSYLHTAAETSHRHTHSRRDIPQTSGQNWIRETSRQQGTPHLSAHRLAPHHPEAQETSSSGQSSPPHHGTSIFGYLPHRCCERDVLRRACSAFCPENVPFKASKWFQTKRLISFSKKNLPRASSQQHTDAGVILCVVQHEAHHRRNDCCPGSAVVFARDQQVRHRCCCLDGTTARFWLLFYCGIPVSSIRTVSPLQQHY